MSFCPTLQTEYAKTIIKFNTIFLLFTYNTLLSVVTCKTHIAIIFHFWYSPHLSIHFKRFSWLDTFDHTTSGDVSKHIWNLSHISSYLHSSQVVRELHAKTISKNPTLILYNLLTISLHTKHHMGKLILHQNQTIKYNLTLIYTPTFYFFFDPFSLPITPRETHDLVLLQ